MENSGGFENFWPRFFNELMRMFPVAGSGGGYSRPAQQPAPAQQPTPQPTTAAPPGFQDDVFVGAYGQPPTQMTPDAVAALGAYPKLT